MSEAKFSHDSINDASRDGSALRLVYLISQYPAANHTYILREVESLRARGFAVETFSISNPDRPPEQMTEHERAEAAQTFYVKAQGLKGALRAHLRTLFIGPLAYIKGLLYALRLNSFDLARKLPNLLYFTEALIIGQEMRRLNLHHAHTHYASTPALLLHKIFPVKISMTIHGSGEFRNPVAFCMAEKVAAASFVCTISSFARSQIMQNSAAQDWSKIEIAPLGVDTEIYSPDARGNLRSEERAGERRAPFEIICVGSLARVKGHLVLFEALATLLNEDRNICLRLVGDGTDRTILEREAVRRGISANVIFEGWRTPDELLALYARADACALASFAEGVPVVLMEAMALGVPCVATFVGGIPELMRDEREGLLVPPADASALAGAIRRLMDDAALHSRLTEAARRRVVERYNLDKNTEQLAEIFRRRLCAASPAETAFNRMSVENRNDFAEQGTRRIMSATSMKNSTVAISKNE